MPIYRMHINNLIDKYSLKAVDLLLLLAGVGILLESYGSLVLVKFEIKVKCWKK